MIKKGIETNQKTEATMKNIEVRCPYSKQIKTVVASLDEYAAIALKSNGVRYEAYNRETGVVTNLDNIGAEGHR